LTVISNLKGTLANAKGIQAAFSDLALKTRDPETQAIFHKCMMETELVVHELQQRVEYIKAEELQYRQP
jgi:hypothetical protein